MRRVLALTLLLAATGAQAATYYVDPTTGNNANNGTSPATPWENPPGTRKVDNGGGCATADCNWWSTTWGSTITGTSATARVRCGDTILFKPNTTQTTGHGGAWCLASGANGSGGNQQCNNGDTPNGNRYYYEAGCSSANPITLTIATPAQWAGASATGNFRVNAPTYGTQPHGVDYAATIAIGNSQGIKLSGLDATRRFEFVAPAGVQSGVNNKCAVWLGGPFGAAPTDVQLSWFDIIGTGSGSEKGLCMSGTDNYLVSNGLIHGNAHHAIDMGLHVDWYTGTGGIVDVELYNNGRANLSGGGNANTDAIYGQAVGRAKFVRVNIHDEATNCINGGSSKQSAGGPTPQIDTFRGIFRDPILRNCGSGQDPNGEGAGIAWDGDGDGVVPHSYLWVWRPLIYGNWNAGNWTNHGDGRQSVWNGTYYANNWRGNGGGTIVYDRTQTKYENHNSIIVPGPFTTLAIGRNSSSTIFDGKPLFNNDLFQFAGSQNDILSTVSWSAAWPNTGGSILYGTNVSFAQAATGGWPLSGGTIFAGSTSPGPNYQARFGSVSGACSTLPLNFGACDFRLCTGPGVPNAACAAASDAIDAGLPWMRAASSGTGTTISVTRGDPLSGNNGTDADIAEYNDPRNVFIAPTDYPTAVGDTIQIAGACGLRTIVSMTGTSITFSGSACSWAAGAGISLPWNGNAVDLGALESGGSAVTTTSTSTIPVPTTTSTTTTTLPGTATSLFSALIPVSTGPPTDPAGPVELGVKFGSAVPGTITAIRFYKAAGNTGTHVGNLWDIAGNRLTTVTFANETAGGWQEQALSVPIHINANTTYVVSYFAPVGAWSYTQDFLLSRFTNSPLYALGTGESPNGVYTYGLTSTFPTTNWGGTHYFVDVVFAADTNPPTTTVTSLPGTTITTTTAVTTSTVVTTTTTSTSTTTLPGPFKGSGIGGGSIR